MQPDIRKIVSYREDTLIEGHKPADTPLEMIAVAAVLTNPWTARFVGGLGPEIRAFGPVLGALLTDRITRIAGGGARIEVFGKAGVVGLEGEVEHASGLIHTLRFGNHFRAAVGAKSYLAFANIRAAANTAIQIPLMDKNDAGRRSHYHTIQFAIADAPRAHEIVVALGAATGGRPHHRIGDRCQDIKELGHDLDNPVAV
ncbi:amino acid synthesis family protein [Roseobacter weihaiensis]|uniref:amino acid synthesis family protein n=1 Tax=Roseobacter weihaiensis TaxID=2763262 RepID=UPI001D0B3B70|nr:amino acid synthesis family protein [Roseobacter sp. H9]